jgi:excisionase family DNA binding protein
MNYISTGKAARIFSVTPDTVLKWIKKGRLAAARTAGGHYRISRQSIDGLLAEGASPAEEAHPEDSGEAMPCWEFHAENGAVKKECLSCIVFEVRGTRCYKVGKALKNNGGGATCCPTDCEECSYYKMRRQWPVNVLVFGGNGEIESTRVDVSDVSRIRLKHMHGDSDSPIFGNSFHPEYIVIVCGRETAESEKLFKRLSADPGINGTEFMLAVPPDRQHEINFGQGAALINYPFTLSELEILVENYDMLPREVSPKKAFPMKAFPEEASSEDASIRAGGLKAPAPEAVITAGRHSGDK